MKSIEREIRDMSIILKPIGWVESPIKSSVKMPPPEDREEFDKWKAKVKEEERRIKNSVMKLVILPEFEEMLEGIEEFFHIVVTFWSHLLSKKRSAEKYTSNGYKTPAT